MNVWSNHALESSLNRFISDLSPKIIFKIDPNWTILNSKQTLEMNENHTPVLKR